MFMSSRCLSVFNSYWRRRELCVASLSISGPRLSNFTHSDCPTICHHMPLWQDHDKSVIDQLVLLSA